MVETLEAIRSAMRENMEAAQCRMVKYFNQKVIEKEPTFKVDNWCYEHTLTLTVEHVGTSPRRGRHKRV